MRLHPEPRPQTRHRLRHPAIRTRWRVRPESGCRSARHQRARAPGSPHRVLLLQMAPPACSSASATRAPGVSRTIPGCSTAPATCTTTDVSPEGCAVAEPESPPFACGAAASASPDDAAADSYENSAASPAGFPHSAHPHAATATTAMMTTTRGDTRDNPARAVSSSQLSRTVDMNSAPSRRAEGAPRILLGALCPIDTSRI